MSGECCLACDHDCTNVCWCGKMFLCVAYMEAVLSHVWLFSFFFFRRYQNLRVNKHNNSVVLISLRAYLYKCGNPKHLSIFLCVLNEVNELLFKACSCETVTGLFYNRMESVSCYMT